jgi:hypothetical protein
MAVSFIQHVKCRYRAQASSPASRIQMSTLQLTRSLPVRAPKEWSELRILSGGWFRYDDELFLSASSGATLLVLFCFFGLFGSGSWGRGRCRGTGSSTGLICAGRRKGDNFRLLFANSSVGGWSWLRGPMLRRRRRRRRRTGGVILCLTHRVSIGSLCFLGSTTTNAASEGEGR